MKQFSVKFVFLTLTLVLVAGVAFAMSGRPSNAASGQWHYKMTVTVETPEGEVAGFAVREMGNATPLISLPDVGNPAQVKGEAVVVDMGKRGVLFALISHLSDNEFYNAFPVPGLPIGTGGSTADGIRYYANLPVGTKGEITPEKFPSYPKLVTFTDMNDPKSVRLVQAWGRGESGPYYRQEDRMEELFGKGVKLKGITLEITDEPTTWGVVDRYLPWLSEYYNKRLDGNRFGTINTPNKTANAFSAGSFSTGDKK